MFIKDLKNYIKKDAKKLNVSGIKEQINERAAKKKKNKKQLDKGAEVSGLSPTRIVLLQLWRRKYQIISLTVVFVLILCIFFAFQSRNTVNVTMSLNYEEAAKGLNPNSTRFNVYELVSNDVMEQAISYMGLQNELTPERLARNISIKSTNTKAIDIESSQYFISTSFNVTYKKNKNIDMSVKDMMTMICKAYNVFFHKNYGDKLNALSYDLDDISNMEYVEICDAMEHQASRMELYVHKRAKENGSYRSDETGETFKTLERQFQNLSDYDIAKLRAFVLETGLAKDKTSFIQTLNYKNSVLNMEFQKYTANYSVRQDTIAMYDESMIGTVMIPAINDKDEYYMSRTNIGIDYLAKDAESSLEKSTETLKDIETNRDVIDRLSAGVPTDEDYKKADEMINEIVREFNRISQLATAIDKEYIKYKTKDYITFQTSELSLLERLSIKKVIAFGVLFLLAICIIFYYVDKNKLRKRGVIL